MALQSCGSEAISIHSTARVETNLSTFLGVISKFQSTPPRGWRQISLEEYESLRGFQSTPPRGWRPNLQVTSHYRLTISIHSTARVETEYYTLKIHEITISIHSTARVETFEAGGGMEALRHFNPLHREGGDRC